MMVSINPKYYNEPWEHVVINNMFDNELCKLASLSIPNFDSEYWDKGKHYINEYTNKKEINNTELFPEKIKIITDYLTSFEFIKELEKITGINDLIIDNNIYGGGLAVSNKGDFLEKHIDFNFNNDIKLYRAVNLILYLNNDWNEGDGGCFELYDENLYLKKKIIPNINKIVIFKSNNKTIHGFNKINNKTRKSLNLWYYTIHNPKDVDELPHKTIWFSSK